MATICTLSIPTTEFGLAETLQTVPDAQVACEPVALGSQRASLSLLRAHAPDRQALETAFTNDSSVSEWSCLTGGEPSWLYRIEWRSPAALVHDLLTGSTAMMLAATGSGEEWSLRMLYPSREACSHTHTFCEEHNIPVTIDAIQEFDGDHSTRHGLTDAQHTALVRADEMGYFAVPREADLEAVAETLDISHQALSERLRRAHQTLIETTVGRQDTTPPTAMATTVTESETTGSAHHPVSDTDRADEHSAFGGRD